MSQAQKVIQLSEEQIKTTLNNWYKLLKLTDIVTIKDEAHPRFGEEEIKKYNLKLITKFGYRYVLIRGTDEDGKYMYFFIVYSDRFEALHIYACSGWKYLLEGLDDTPNTFDPSYHPRVFVTTNYVVAEGVYRHVPSAIFDDIPYRFVPLPEIYPRIGSKNGVGFLTTDLKIEKNIPKTTTMGKRYAKIQDSDVDVKILNAIGGDLISTRRKIYEDGTIYEEIYICEVIPTIVDPTTINPSGICFGNY